VQTAKPVVHISGSAGEEERGAKVGGMGGVDTETGRCHQVVDSAVKASQIPGSLGSQSFVHASLNLFFFFLFSCVKYR
jgi:hypothetical protein